MNWVERHPRMRKVVIGIAIAAIIALIVWAIPLAPNKEVIITTTEIILTEEERENYGYDEELPTAYLVYYVWDGERDEYQQWSIFQSPLRDHEWIVLETPDVGDLNDTDSFIKAVKSASKFDENWFDYEMHTIQRSRLEKLQHAFFGGGDAFEKERRAIKQVLDAIQLR